MSQLRLRYWIGRKVIAFGRWIVHGRIRWKPVRDPGRSYLRDAE